MARKINRILQEFYLKRDLTLVDFKLEFGRDLDDNIILIDELSPDNFRLWDANTGEKMDKIDLGKDLGRSKSCHEEVLKRSIWRRS